LIENDEVAAQCVLHMKSDINQLAYKALQIQAKRLQQEGSHNIEVTQFENDLIDCMKRIYTLTKRIAKLTVPVLMIQETE
jgi:phosphate:Na+ symporter